MGISAVIRAIRGAPLTVLTVLLLDRERTMGAKEIVAATGYSGPTVADALQTLAAMGLAQNQARYNGWQATAYAWQLLRGEAEAGGGSETRTSCLPSSRCRRHSDDSDPDPDPRSDRRQRRRGEAKTARFPDLPAEWQDLVELLIHRCAAPKAAAIRAIQHARQAELYPSYVRYEILRWLAYCLSDHGKGIRYPGAYITARIEQELSAPPWFHPPWDDLGREIQCAEAAWQAEDADGP
jgi:hypothetical protein